jgi:hypothetical protein
VQNLARVRVGIQKGKLICGNHMPGGAARGMNAWVRRKSGEEGGSGCTKLGGLLDDSKP